MSMDVAALNELTRVARSVGAIETRDRLEEIQGVIGRELVEIEATLARAAERAEPPSDLAAGHLIRAGGKRVRPVATMLCARAAGGEGHDLARVRAVASAVELLHTATLLHDDVMDEGDVRRGLPTARKIHGNLVSVLGGDFLLVGALREVSALADPVVLADFVQTLEALVRGEVLQLRARRELIIDREHYLSVVRGKTASLFGWCCRNGARVAHGSEAIAVALGEFGERIGTAYQLLDDVIDVSGTTDHTGKSAWADLREGKATWPVIVAVEAGTVTRGDLLAAQGGDEAAVRALVDGLARAGAMDATRAVAAHETRLAMEALGRVPVSPARTALEMLASSLVERDR